MTYGAKTLNAPAQSSRYRGSLHASVKHIILLRQVYYADFPSRPVSPGELGQMTLLLGISHTHNRSRQFTMPGDTSHKHMPFLQLTPYAVPTSSHVKPRLCHGCSGCALSAKETLLRPTCGSEKLRLA
jgi:hypothetical protein